MGECLLSCDCGVLRFNSLEEAKQHTREKHPTWIIEEKGIRKPDEMKV
jgi:hypothetical protein